MLKRFMTIAVASACCHVPLCVQAASPTPPLPAVASQPHYDFQVVYDVFAGGLHLLDITQDFRLTATDYTSVLTAEPTGFFNRLVPWQGRYATQGVVVKGRLGPLRYVETSRWGDERTETVMKFDAHGDIRQRTTVEWLSGRPKPTPQDVTPDPALTHDTIDMVTAVLQMLQHAQRTGLTTSGACDTASTVFDGKRRFVMQFSDQGDDRLKPSAHSVFTGLARQCQLEIKPLAGFPRKNRGYYKIQEDSRAHGSLPALWLMPAWDAPDAPPIPVRMMVHSPYGTILVHATRVVRKP